MAITKILTKLDHALRLLPFLGDEQRAALQVRRVRKLVERGESLDDVRVVQHPYVVRQRGGVARHVDDSFKPRHEFSDFRAHPRPRRVHEHSLQVVGLERGHVFEAHELFPLVQREGQLLAGQPGECDVVRVVQFRVVLSRGDGNLANLRG